MHDDKVVYAGREGDSVVYNRVGNNIKKEGWSDSHQVNMMRLQFVRATSLKSKAGHVKHPSMAQCFCAYHITHPFSADKCILCCIGTTFTPPTLKIQAVPAP